MAIIGNCFFSGSHNNPQKTSPSNGKQKKNSPEERDSSQSSQQQNFSVRDAFTRSSSAVNPVKQELVPEWLKVQVKGFKSSLASCAETEKYQGHDVQEVISRRARERMLINSRNSLSLAYDRELSDRGDLIKLAFTFPIIGRYSRENSVNVLDFGAVDGISANMIIEQLRSNAGIESTVYLVNSNGRIASLNYPGVERIESSPLELNIKNIEQRYERLGSKGIDAVLMRFSLGNYDQEKQLELLKTARSLLSKGGLLLILDEGPEFGSDYNDFMHRVLADDSSKHYSSLAEVIETARDAEFALNDDKTYGGKPNPLSLTRTTNKLLYCTSLEQQFEERFCFSDQQKQELRVLFRENLDNDNLKIFQAKRSSFQETVSRGVIHQELVSFDDFYIVREVYAAAFKAV